MTSDNTMKPATSNTKKRNKPPQWIEDYKAQEKARPYVDHYDFEYSEQRMYEDSYQEAARNKYGYAFK
jgi:hypothetical protein